MKSDLTKTSFDNRLEIGLANVVFILALFPYVSIIKTPFDIQPYVLLFSGIYFLMYIVKGNLKFPTFIGVFFLVFLYAFLIYIINSEWINGIRSLFGYASLFLISFTAYKTFRFINVKLYIIGINIWLLFGCVQYFIQKDFGSLFVARMSTTFERGVTSLAVEPSAYAMICIFFIILNEIFYKSGKYSKKIYYFNFVCIFIQLILTFSGMSILLILIYLFVKTIANSFVTFGIKGLSYLLGSFLIGSILILCFINIPILETTRAGYLIGSFITYGFNIIYLDASMNDRFAHIIIPGYSLYNSYGIGFGLGTWSVHSNDIISDFQSKYSNSNFDFYSVTSKGRIMSGWGNAVYELGFIGVLIMLTYIRLIIIAFSNKGIFRDVVFTGIIIIFILAFMSLSLAFPLLSYITGVSIYLLNPNEVVKLKGDI